MAEIAKKDIFDYLRNLQKSAEIEAKVNGVNVWALLGAAALVLWQLLGNPIIWDSSNIDLVLQTIVGAQAVYILIGFLTPGRRKDDVRFLTVGVGDPYMWIVSGINICAPLVLYALYVEKSFVLLVPFCLGLLPIVFGLKELTKYGRAEKKVAGTLPRPTLSFASKFDWVFGAATFGVLSWILYSQLSILVSRMTPDMAKAMGMVAVLYLLSMAILDRRSQNRGINWTYELETDLLLNVVSPEEALQRIEYRRLGPRLRDVVDAFCRDLDERFDKFDQEMESCRLQIATISEVPEKFVHERKARVDAATLIPKSVLQALERDSARFLRYIEEIEAKYKLVRREAVFQSILKSLYERYNSYHTRLERSRSELDAIGAMDSMKHDSSPEMPVAPQSTQ